MMKCFFQGTFSPIILGTLLFFTIVDDVLGGLPIGANKAYLILSTALDSCLSSGLTSSPGPPKKRDPVPNGRKCLLEDDRPRPRANQLSIGGLLFPGGSWFEAIRQFSVTF